MTTEPPGLQMPGSSVLQINDSSVPAYDDNTSIHRASSTKNFGPKRLDHRDRHIDSECTCFAKLGPLRSWGQVESPPEVPHHTHTLGPGRRARAYPLIYCRPRSSSRSAALGDMQHRDRMTLTLRLLSQATCQGCVWQLTEGQTSVRGFPPLSEYTHALHSSESTYECPWHHATVVQHVAAPRRVGCELRMHQFRVQAFAQSSSSRDSRSHRSQTRVATGVYHRSEHCVALVINEGPLYPIPVAQS